MKRIRIARDNHIISYPLALVKQVLKKDSGLYELSPKMRGCLTVREYGTDYGTLFDYLLKYHREEGVLIQGFYDSPRGTYVYCAFAPTETEPLRHVYDYRKKALKEAGFAEKEIFQVYTGNY